MRIFFPLALAAGFVSLAAPAAWAQNAELATPAIDRDLFRPGEVTRSTRDYAKWNIVCDEVRKLKQKFCSLRTIGIDATGLPLVSMVVSTADNGRPAALVSLPFGITLAQRIVLSSAGIKGKISPVKLEFTASACTPEGCNFVWPLRNIDIQNLRNGADFQVSFYVARHDNTPGDPYARQRQAVLVSARIFAAGFNEAVLDSTK